MAKVKVMNISPHSPLGEILEMEEAKALALEKTGQVMLQDEVDKKDKKETKQSSKIDKVKKQKIEG